MGESVPAAPDDGSLGSGRLPRAQLQGAIPLPKEVAHDRFVAASTGVPQGHDRAVGQNPSTQHELPLKTQARDRRDHPVLLHRLACAEAQIEKTTRAKEIRDVRDMGTSGIILGRWDDG